MTEDSTGRRNRAGHAVVTPAGWKDGLNPARQAAVVVKQATACFNSRRNTSMPRHLIKRYAPSPASLKGHKYLRHLGTLLHDENLWHLNRRSVSGGVASGLFWAMIPFPVQMLTSALTAIVFRINLPISVALVWITNPVTIPPIFYMNYLIGTWMLGAPASVGEFKLSVDWIAAELNVIWKPLVLGSLVIAVLLSATGYFAMRMYWRWHVLRRFRARGKSRAERRTGVGSPRRAAAPRRTASVSGPSRPPGEDRA